MQLGLGPHEPLGGTALSAAVPRQVRRSQSRCRCGRGEPSPDADVAGVSPVPVRMWHHARQTGGSRCDRRRRSPRRTAAPFLCTHTRSRSLLPGFHRIWAAAGQHCRRRVAMNGALARRMPTAAGQSPGTRRLRFKGALWDADRVRDRNEGSAGRCRWHVLRVRDGREGGSSGSRTTALCIKCALARANVDA